MPPPSPSPPTCATTSSPPRATPDLAVYVNYASGNETLEQRYGASKLKRLAATKKEWNPSQVSGYSNPLPTKYP